MQDRDSSSAGASRPPWPAQSHALYVITLLASPAPVRLQAPDTPELAGLAVFRSRLVEDGRERFRLHVGYFQSAAEAERLLPALRRVYPAAFVAPAPRSDMGSLDDTAMARFRILQAPDAGAADAHPPEPASHPVAAPVRRAAAPVRRNVAAVPAATAATAPMPPVLQVPPAARAAAAAALQPTRGRPVARAEMPQPRPVAPVARADVPEPHRVEPVLRAEIAERRRVAPVARAEMPQPRPVAPVARAELPEPRRTDPMAPAHVPEPPGAEPTARAEALQKFAVQLMWTRERIDVAQIARLKIFNGYLLYAVETEPGGRHENGVRLGFYGDALSAGLVAQYVRPVFKNATVVPVSEREFERAAAARIRVAPASAPGARAQWPARPVPVALVSMAR